MQKEEFKERRNVIAKSGRWKQSRQQFSNSKKDEIYARILEQSGRQHSNAYNRLCGNQHSSSRY